MKCDQCDKIIGTKDEPAYQVRVGYLDEDGDFLPDEDVGYYCGYCLAWGVSKGVTYAGEPEPK